MKMLKPTPKFKSTDEEREFWLEHDSSEYIDWSEAKSVVFPNLKPTTQTISLRMPISLLDRVKVAAHKNDMPYQSYMKSLIAKSV